MGKCINVASCLVLALLWCLGLLTSCTSTERKSDFSSTEAGIRAANDVYRVKIRKVVQFLHAEDTGRPQNLTVFFQVFQWCLITRTFQKETIQSDPPEKDSLGKGPESLPGWPDMSQSVAGKPGSRHGEVWFPSSLPRVASTYALCRQNLSDKNVIRWESLLSIREIKCFSNFWFASVGKDFLRAPKVAS